MNPAHSSQQSLLKLVARGIAGSAQKLSEISKSNWKVQASSIQAEPIGHFQGLLSADNTEHIGIYSSMPDGLFLVVFSKLSSSILAKSFLMPSGAAKPVVGREQEALCEIASMLVNPIADTLADACDMGFFLSVPEISHAAKGKLLSQMSEKFKTDGDAIAIKADIHMAQSSVACDCSVVLLLNSRWQQRIS